MPRLTFPFAADGLLVPALVNRAAPELQAAHLSGTPLPASVRVRGMLDSGTTVTAVVPRVLSTLNIQPGPTLWTTTPAGILAVRSYRISFTIHNAPHSSDTLHRGDWLVTDLPSDLDDIEVLFGLDLLRQVVLHVDGPNTIFHIDF
jgi:hypothetical protein